MKKNVIIRIVLWSALAVALTVFLVQALVKSDNQYNNIFDFLPKISFNNGSTSYADYEDEESYNIGNGKIEDNIRELTVNWISGEVNVLPYDGKTVKIEEIYGDSTEEKFKLRYKAENEELIIHPCTSEKISAKFGKFPQKTLNIYIPVPMAKVLENISINTVSATVLLSENINARKINIATVSGIISLKDTFAQEIKADTTSGKIILTNVTANKLTALNVSGLTEIASDTQSLSCESVSGKTLLDLADAPKKADLTAVSGKIELKIPENNGFTVKFDSVSGNFTSDFELQTGENKQKSYKNGENEYTIETVSGSVKILKK